LVRAASSCSGACSATQWPASARTTPWTSSATSCTASAGASRAAGAADQALTDVVQNLYDWCPHQSRQHMSMRHINPRGGSTAARPSARPSWSRSVVSVLVSFVGEVSTNSRPPLRAAGGHQQRSDLPARAAHQFPDVGPDQPNRIGLPHDNRQRDKTGDYQQEKPGPSPVDPFTISLLLHPLILNKGSASRGGGL
jgi:hypothetical protein